MVAWIVAHYINLSVLEETVNNLMPEVNFTGLATLAQQSLAENIVFLLSRKKYTLPFVIFLCMCVS
jgi:hypothetical protein